MKKVHKLISHQVNLQNGTITFRYVGGCTLEQKEILLKKEFYNSVSTDVYGRKTKNSLSFFVSPKNGNLYLEFTSNSGNVANAKN